MRVLSMLVEKDTRLQYNHLWLLGFLLLQSQSYINIVNHINKRDSFVDIHLAYQFTLWDELLWIWSSTLYLATNFPNGGHVHRLSSKPRAQQSTWDFLFIIILEVLFLFLVLDLLSPTPIPPLYSSLLVSVSIFMEHIFQYLLKKGEWEIKFPFSYMSKIKPDSRPGIELSVGNHFSSDIWRHCTLFLASNVALEKNSPLVLLSIFLSLSFFFFFGLSFLISERFLQLYITTLS